jgi:FkbM family methyltransferase
MTRLQERLAALREPWSRSYAVRRRALLWRLGRLAAPDPAVPTEYLGTDYGGWAVPRDVIRPGWVCYCAGAGIDISFDLALAQRFGCEVVTLDPTDESADHVARAAAGEPKLRFEQVAVWSSDGELRMYRAADPAHQTLSADDLQRTDRATTVAARSLPSLMRELGHERIDLLKLDVEGAEYELLDLVAGGQLGVSVLCVEMHPTRGIAPAVRAFRALLAAGFRLVDRRGGDFSFYRPSASASAARCAGRAAS